MLFIENQKHTKTKSFFKMNRSMETAIFELVTNKFPEINLKLNVKSG